MRILGVDTGGTFTDFVHWDGHALRIHKVLSTPDAPERAILQGVRELGLDDAPLLLVHGSTVATNAALEGKGVRTAFVTNRGFADLLTLGRQNRLELYNLRPTPLAPPVPAELCLETGGRINAAGEVLEPVSGEELEALHDALVELKVEAVAINLLFSYLRPEQEQRLVQAIPEGVFVACSSKVLPEIREYERGMATWLNAWLGPKVQGYLQRLQSGLPDARVSVMQSSGETVAADQAADQAVRMLLSGPAGGLVGARFVAAASGRSRLLSFDMGGTSTDVALIDGEPRLTSEGRIGPYPVAVPMVDMHTIGAGGGSIAYLDQGGMLQVGPESAGAAPGPACYGRGGKRPTVTDANLVLGRLRADAFLGGRMTLDVAAAEQAMATVAEPMGMSITDAALGVVRVANEHMARALRTISVEKGLDPRDYTLISFGGAGSLHVCDLADQLGLSEALVPSHGGVLSALGMLAARPGRQLSRTWLTLLHEVEQTELDTALEVLAAQGHGALEAEGKLAEDCEVSTSLDLRYAGQSYTLNIPYQSVADCVAAFHMAHRRRYGHELDLPVELVNLRVRVQGPANPIGLGTARARLDTRPAGAGSYPVYRREQLAPGEALTGPAVITEQVATTWLAPGWRAWVDEVGSLLLSRD